MRSGEFSPQLNISMRMVVLMGLCAGEVSIWPCSSLLPDIRKQRERWAGHQHPQDSPEILDPTTKIGVCAACGLVMASVAGGCDMLQYFYGVLTGRKVSELLLGRPRA